MSGPEILFILDKNMQMNMNSGRSLLDFNSSSTPLFSKRARTMMMEDKISPWDKKVFTQLHRELEERGGLGGNIELMEAWLVSVMSSSPDCLIVLPCLALEEWFSFDTSSFCKQKSTCALFDQEF